MQTNEVIPSRRTNHASSASRVHKVEKPRAIADHGDRPLVRSAVEAEGGGNHADFASAEPSHPRHVEAAALKIPYSLRFRSFICYSVLRFIFNYSKIN